MSLEPHGLERAVAAAAFRTACRFDVLARKPGNVSIEAAGHGMSAVDFLVSARVAANPATAYGEGIGRSILAAIDATFAAVRCNTNLGITLLSVPLLHASVIAHPSRHLAERLSDLLAASTVKDAVAVYAAIRIAKPAGLGTSRAQDVAETPTLPLVDVMRLAAARDAIAAQYANGFQDVFLVGVPNLRHARDQTGSLTTAVVECFLAFLSSMLDSHIWRKHGKAVAETVQARARAVASACKACEDPNARTSILNAFDNELKNEGVNPGTSADLTVASLLALLLDTALKTDACGA